MQNSLAVFICGNFNPFLFLRNSWLNKNGLTKVIVNQN